MIRHGQMERRTTAPGGGSQPRAGNPVLHHLLCQSSVPGQRGRLLETGKPADFIVLDTDLLACPVDAIREARVLQTYCGGRLVFQR
ncbi:MAG: amidohydrolase family protein [Phycisphaerae bacterium]|nr:amidohydrolase family protein [Phycisphaerae bacterium]